MAFGQASGPPARARQLEVLLALVREAGHADFHDARGPLGFTQRQAAGKFTHDEAAAFIEQLQEASDAGVLADDATPPPTSPAHPAPARPVVPPAKVSNAEQTLRKFPSSMLAAELQRRGWIVVEP